MLLPDSLLSVIYPQSCHLCGRSVERHADGVACAACWAEAVLFDGRQALCYKCSAVLTLEDGSYVTAFCRRCDDDHFDRAHAIGIYDGALYASIINLKEKPFVPERLTGLLYDAFVTNDLFRTTRIIPVPLSARRKWERGFNQAAVIAHALGSKLNIPVDELSLIRKIHTDRHRAGMDRKARQETVKNAFEVKRSRLVKGERILLIDDIFTSGATISNCAKVLKKAGAIEVDALTIARAV